MLTEAASSDIFSSVTIIAAISSAIKPSQEDMGEVIKGVEDSIKYDAK